jgi:hypothetical protein
MSHTALTEAEIAYLMKQPGVAAALARYNRSQAYQSADHATTMHHTTRCRMFERLDRKPLRTND